MILSQESQQSHDLYLDSVDYCTYFVLQEEEECPRTASSGSSSDGISAPRAIHSNTTCIPLASLGHALKDVPKTSEQCSVQSLQSSHVSASFSGFQGTMGEHAHLLNLVDR